MNAQSLYEVVDKCIGPISPVGDSGQDSYRLRNLKILGELMEMHMNDLDYIASMPDRAEYSMMQIILEARRIIRSLQ